MKQFIGEFDCRLDSKGRLALPSALYRQFPTAMDRFVVNRGFERHLVLYPWPAWERISTEINQLNLYVKKHRQFVRYFYRGATELKLDAQHRLLLPRRLLDYAEISAETVLFAYADRIEIWASHHYEALLDDEPEDFADLAEDIMGCRRSSDEGPDPEGKA